MRPSRVIIRSPQVCRVVRAPSCTRPMSLFSVPQYYPRYHPTTFPSFGSEIAPLFRLMDEFASTTRALDNFFPFQARPVAQFQPRFDVREVDGTYELRGELPGVDSSALQVEFTDAQTLVIRGTTTTEKTSGTPPVPEAEASVAATPSPAVEANEPTNASATAAETTEPTTAVDNSDAASTHSASSYQKPTVEDEDGVLVGDSPAGSVAPTPTESISETQQQVTDTTVKSSPVEKQQPTQAPREQGHYWISERTTGSFQRVFTFPSRINQEGVKASLKNGVLNITVPKASAPTSRRINVE